MLAAPAPDASDEPDPGEAALPALFAGELLVLGEEDGLLAGALGLPAGEVTGVTPGDDAPAVAVGLPQIVSALGVACFFLLALALALALAVALDVGVPLALLVALGLPLPDTPGEGLAAVEPAAETAGLAAPDAVTAGLDEASAGVPEAAADDCGQDAIGDGRWCRAAVVEYAPPPPAAACPLSGAAELAALVELLPLKADDTDEVSAWRSGGTEARTTPAASTAQAMAMAGLIRPTRQSHRAPGRA